MEMNQNKPNACVVEPIGKSTKNLYQRMLCVMDDIGHIQKKGYNTFHKYKYVTEADIAEKLSSLMVSHRIYMATTVLEKSMQTLGNQNLVSVKIKVIFVNVDDTTDKMEAEFYGDGTDKGDKGVYKAITGAVKYALLKTFMISAGDDPEKDNSSESNAELSVSQKQSQVLTDFEINKLLDLLQDKARLGTSMLQQQWKALKPFEQSVMLGKKEVLKQIAYQADQKLAKE